MDAILGRLADTVSQAEDLEGLTRPLLELLESITRLESTYLTTIDEPRGVQNILYARNTQRMQIPEGLSVPWNDTLCKRALMEGRAYTDDVAGCWGDSDAARALGINTYLSQPVKMLDGSVYGTLCGASESKVVIPPETIRILGLFAQLIAHQVERERQLQSLRRSNEELSRRSLTDPLTGVGNRRALLQELERTLERSRRQRVTVQVAFIDLDGFKAINDLYGHEAGDSLLQDIARKLTASVRTTDFVARYGGDEFVVVTCNADLADLSQRLQRLTCGRYVRNDTVIDYGGASVGVAVAAPDEADAELLLSRADAAMYLSKQQRRSHQAAAH